MWTPKSDKKYLKKAKGHIGPKHCDYKNKDQGNSPNILSNNNNIVSSISYTDNFTIKYIVSSN